MQIEPFLGFRKCLRLSRSFGICMKPLNNHKHSSIFGTLITTLQYAMIMKFASDMKCSAFRNLKLQPGFYQPFLVVRDHVCSGSIVPLERKRPASLAAGRDFRHLSYKVCQYNHTAVLFWEHVREDIQNKGNGALKHHNFFLVSVLTLAKLPGLNPSFINSMCLLWVIMNI